LAGDGRLTAIADAQTIVRSRPRPAEPDRWYSAYDLSAVTLQRH
jgi:hypothetical protein